MCLLISIHLLLTLGEFCSIFVVTNIHKIESKNEEKLAFGILG